MRSVKKAKDGARKAPSGCESGRKTDRRLVPFDRETTERLVSVAEELSELVGINPKCVTKKMPSNINPNAYEKTIEDFLEAEARCAEVNSFWFGPGNRDTCVPFNLDQIKVSSSVKYILKEASRFINKTISQPWTKASKLYLGPGSAQVFTYTKGDNHVAFKTKERLWKLAQADSAERYPSASKWIRPSRSFQSSEFFDNAISSYIDERLDEYELATDIISCVPKNNEKYRTIGIGSVVGVASQHVIGDYIRKCMKRQGIDLNNLSQRHKEYAYLGSVNGRYSTLDFSQASDTISLALVSLLFNNTKSSDKVRYLYEMMLQCRSTYYTIAGPDGSYDLKCRETYEKFAPMGCCFTFELESLIFTAIGRAIQKRLGFLRLVNNYRGPMLMDCVAPTSFGDDLILSLGRLNSRELRLIQAWFWYFGLKLNDEKSFCQGEDFRESCGADFKNGRYVRGFYFHQSDLALPDLIRMLNFFHNYYGVKIKYILEKYPAIRKLFDYYSLQDYCIGRVKVTRLLDAYKIIPSTVLVTDEFPETGRYLAIRDCLRVKRAIPECRSGSEIDCSLFTHGVSGYRYFACDSKRKGLIYSIDDLLVPFIQGKRYSLEVDSFDPGSYVRYTSENQFWRDYCYEEALTMGLLDIAEPIVWTAANCRCQTLRPTRFTKNGWDRKPRLML